MKIMSLDASKWQTWQDVSDAILAVLDAPKDYNKGSIDAILELMVFGEVGAIEPPYIIKLSSTENLPTDAAEWLGWIVEGLAEYREDQIARCGRDIEANLEILS